MRSDRGSAVVGFALVVPLLMAVALAAVQGVLLLHARAVLDTAAYEGARAAALAGSDEQAGRARARAVLDDGLVGASLVDADVRPLTVDGVPVMRVRLEATMPLLGLLASRTLVAQAHAVREGWS